MSYPSVRDALTTLFPTASLPSLPELQIDDVSVTEGNSGTVNASFTVQLSAPSAQTVTVDYATADGTATLADNDYGAASGTLTFTPGQTSQTITAPVYGDAIFENDETFVVNLSNAPNATIVKGVGVGTILNDDDAFTGAGATIAATEGTTFSETVATFTDANLSRTAGDFSAAIAWGDGTAPSLGVVSTAGDGTFTVSGSHAYAEETSAAAIDVVVQAPGGAAITIRSTAHVADASLTATSLTIAATEGLLFSGTVAHFTDSDAGGEVGDYTAAIDWGDGATTPGTIMAGSGGGFQVAGSHVFAEEGQDLPVRVVISDVGGARATAMSTANVVDAGLRLSPVAISIASPGAANDVRVAIFSDDGGPEPASQYSAVIDWGDGNSSPGAIQLSGGVFQITGSHQYATGGEFPVHVSVQDEGGSSAEATVQVVVNISPSAEFVIAVYEDVLARLPDPAGLDYWTQVLGQGAERSRVAQAIAHSDEYFANFVIKPDYIKFLGRAADAAGIQYWLQRFHGGLTDQRFTAGLAASDEFFANAGGTNLGWVDMVYTELLGRDADSDGETYWTDQLSKGVSRYDVAARIAASNENNVQLIDGDYAKFLSRGADEAALEYWLDQLAHGGTPEDLIAALTGSGEYYKLHTGLDQ